eukprot:1184340-Prorocentrum_minimum.AAC.4
MRDVSRGKPRIRGVQWALVCTLAIASYWRRRTRKNKQSNIIRFLGFESLDAGVRWALVYFGGVPVQPAVGHLGFEG